MSRMLRVEKRGPKDLGVKENILYRWHFFGGERSLRSEGN